MKGHLKFTQRAWQMVWLLLVWWEEDIHDLPGTCDEREWEGFART